MSEPTCISVTGHCPVTAGGKSRPEGKSAAWQAIEDIFGGQYQIIRSLGRGGQSQVYCGKQMSDGRLFAIKHVKPGSIGDMEENLRILSRLNHPQIPCLHAMEVRGEEVYIVQDYFPGDSLKKILRDSQRMHTRVPWKKAMQWMRSACEPLEYIHSLNPAVLHCDVKPANLVLWSGNDRICLMDFDISRETGETQRISSTMSVAYASPEQKRFDKLDQRTDIYSLGITFFQLTTGQLPGEGFFHWLLPLRVRRLLERCMADRPDARFQSVRELKTALEEFF